jgi:endogenous inhibitor of DNA gyrase (YacG/DUF329 family)
MSTPTATQRTCDQCATPIQVTRRNPNRRFCSARCRRAAHRQRTAPSPAIHNAITAQDVDPNAGPTSDAVPNGVPAVNGVQRCPHCRHELAVLAVIIPAKAAHVRLPEVTPHDP